MSAKIVDNKADPFTLVLARPVDLAGVAYNSLTLTEPTTGQVEAASGKPTAVASNIALVASVAKIPEAVVRLMAYTDFKQAVDYLDFFMTGGRATGET